MKRKMHVGAWLLILLGLTLIAVGLGYTARIPSTLEYTLLPPTTQTEIETLVKKKDTALEGMKSMIEASCVSAIRSQTSIRAEDAGTSETVMLRAGGPGFFAVYPRYLISGRLISETELAEGALKIVLDEEVAFRLFPTIDPIGQMVEAENGKTFEVVGVVRHRRTVGEAALFNAYIPLLAAPDQPYDILSLSVAPLLDAGADIMLAGVAADNWQSGGELWSTHKEVMRARLPILYTLCIFAFALVLRILYRCNRMVAGWIYDIRARLQTVYPSAVVGRAAGCLGMAILLYGALLLALYGIARVAVEPLYTFPEWVPENIVEWSSLRNVFWNLAERDSRLVRCATPTIRAIGFWRGTVLWGALFTLVGTLLQTTGRKTS